jgi:hypothetical protein
MTRPSKAIARREFYAKELARGGHSERETARLTAALADAERALVGSCDRCGRKLTDPDSVALGRGPECRKASVAA